jgi:hypothetical protein
LLYLYNIISKNDPMIFCGFLRVTLRRFFVPPRAPYRAGVGVRGWRVGDGVARGLGLINKSADGRPASYGKRILCDIS